jgi:hypothetical protein
MKTSWLCLAILLAGLAATAPAQDKAKYDPAGKSLKGVKAIYVLTEVEGEDTAAFGPDTLRSDVENLLDRAGVVTLPIESLVDGPPGLAYLQLQLTSSTVGTTNRLYSITLRLKQRVRLVRDPDTMLWAPTWEAADQGITPVKDTREIHATVRDLVAEFVGALLTANSGAK